MTSYEPRHEISNNLVCTTSKASDQPGHTFSLTRAFASRFNSLMTVKLLTENQLEFLSLKKADQSYSKLGMSKYHIFVNHMSWPNHDLKG